VNDDVELARSRFVAQVDAVREDLDRDWGWAPKGARWLLPLAGVAAGIFAGGALLRVVRRLFRTG
jgi:hypothetical protein